MTQSFLCPDDDLVVAQPLPLVGVPVGKTALSKGQKRFNRLIADIQAQRLMLAQWHDFHEVFQGRMASEFVPLQDRLHEKRVSMAKLFDQALAHPSLSKRQRAKIQDILQNLLADLVQESDDLELVALHDKHSEMTLKELHEHERGLAQAMASQLFGIEVDIQEAQTPQEMVQEIQQKLHEQIQAEREDAQQKNATRKKSAKTLAAEAQREKAAQVATQSLREVYRKLVSELHPDRELDTTRRDEKTALMKRVNQAYEAADLLALLELQLEIEQIDAQALAGLSEERVQHFNAVLTNQLKQLQEEVHHFTQPLVGMVKGWGRKGLSVASAKLAMDNELKELKRALKAVQRDLECFQDIKQLKASLRHYEIAQQDEDLDWDMLDYVLMDELRKT